MKAHSIRTRPTVHGAVLPALLFATMFVSASCGGGGGGVSVNPSGACTGGDWFLSVSDLTPGGACVDLGLDSTTVNLKAVPPGPSAGPGTVQAAYLVSSSALDTAVPDPQQSTMGAFEIVLDGSLLGYPGEVNFMAFTGYYYNEASDITVSLETGPTLSEFGQVTTDCDSFTTFVDYTIYSGDVLETILDSDGFYVSTIPGTAVEICSGRMRVDGSRSAPLTEGENTAELPGVLGGVLEFGEPELSLEVLGEVSLSRNTYRIVGTDGFVAELYETPRGSLEIVRFEGGNVLKGLAGTLDPAGAEARGTVLAVTRSGVVMQGTLSLRQGVLE